MGIQFLPASFSGGAKPSLHASEKEKSVSSNETHDSEDTLDISHKPSKKDDDTSSEAETLAETVKKYITPKKIDKKTRKIEKRIDKEIKKEIKIINKMLLKANSPEVSSRDAQSRKDDLCSRRFDLLNTNYELFNKEINIEIKTCKKHGFWGDKRSKLIYNKKPKTN